MPYTRVVWTYVPTTNTLKTAAVAATVGFNYELGGCGFATEDGGYHCGKLMTPKYGSATGYATFTEANNAALADWHDRAISARLAPNVCGFPCHASAEDPNIIYLSDASTAPIPATYTRQLVVWDCRSDVNPSGSAPGALPTNCTDISPAPTVVSSSTNSGTGWSHSP